MFIKEHVYILDEAETGKFNLGMPELIGKGYESPLRQVDHFYLTEGESLLVTK